MEKSQKTRQKANRWSWGGTLQTNTPCTTAGTLTYITYITQYLLTHSTTHHRHSQLYSHFFPLCIGAHTPDACLCQCLSCINMSACPCVSVLFCHVYIWTFQIRCPLLLLRIHTLLCLSLFLSPPLALKFKLSLSPWLSLSPSHSRLALYLLYTLCFLCHCPFPSWPRFCRVSFPLSTRPCWTGAHAECFQSLLQIRNDIPMWI